MSIDQGRPQRHALGIDFGTSNTVAVARWPDGRARPILVDGSPLLPSAVYAEPDGQLIVGRDAVHSARLDPARFEPNPKRRIDDGLVLLGDRELPVVDLIAAVLARVAEEWHRAVGPVRPDVTLTCPATWGATRRGLIAEAAARAGLEGARLVAEPVAAATYFAEVLGRDVPIGSVVVVHDFGAGTFDASVVARTAEGFEVLAVDGRDDIGGLDVDAALVSHLFEAGWERLMEPATLEERRAQRQLWDEVRIAKERLSRNQSADFVVPLLNREVHLTRDELETVARPVLDQTVQVTRGLLRWAELPEGRLAGVFLVGGASRIPLVATLLHRALGEAPVVIEQPELVVAEGSILADAALLATGPAAPGPTAELRLVSSRRAEAETVRVAASSLLPRSGPGASSPTAPRPSAVAAPPSGASPAAASGSFSGSGSFSRPGSVPVDEQETVRSAPDGSALPPPAVDPWPHAAPERWVPDPDATVAGEPSWDPSQDHWTPASTPASTPPTSPAPPPPVSPAGSGRTSSAWPGSPGVPAPGTRPMSPAPQPSSRPYSPGAQPGRGSSSAQPGRGISSAQAGRGTSPAQAGRGTSPAQSGRGSSSARPMSPAQSRPAATVRRDAPAARPRARRPRRSGGFLRFLQILLSIAVLIAVPVAAMVLAYASRTGEAPQEAATQLLKDLANLVNNR
jgi:actin-like ATPase involved in cell morphogenesis